MAPQVSPVALGTAGAVALVSIIGMLSKSFQTATVLIPGNTLMGNHHVWNLATSVFVEKNILKLVVAVVVICYLANEAAPRFSHLHLGLLVAAGCFGSALIVSMGAVFAFMMTYDETLLFGDMFGTTPLAMAFAVGLVQTCPDGVVPHAGGLKHSAIPIILLGQSLVSEFLLDVTEDFPQTIACMVCAWTFLRFFAPHDVGRGDFRDEFAFVRLFPEAFRPPIAVIDRVVSFVCLRLSCFQPPAAPKPKVAPGITHEPVHGFTPEKAAVASDPVTERRRQKALKILQSRMQQLAGAAAAEATPTAPGPLPMATTAALPLIAPATAAIATTAPVDSVV